MHLLKLYREETYLHVPRIENQMSNPHPFTFATNLTGVA